MISITCNGQTRELSESLSVSQLVDELGVGAKRFAVELNREVVSKDRLGDVLLQDGDEVNIVTLVGGG
ncbi:MAG: sulfur carrier protein ThiS [bacterium]